MSTVPERQHDLGDCSDLSPVPLHVVLRDGTIVGTTGPIWRLCGASERGKLYCINWGQFDDVGTFPLLTVRARHLLKLYLADRLSKKKAMTVRSNYRSFIRFARWLAKETHEVVVLPESQGFNWSDLSEGMARAFLEWSVKHTAEKGIDFSCLRTFYEWGVARGYADFRRDTLSVLHSIKAESNPKGHHVRFRHPVKGPFSSDELLLIKKALQEKKGEDRDRAIVMLHLELGLNPYASVQIANADFKRYETEHLTTYQIDVPRIKKRMAHRETKRRPISGPLGQQLEQLQQGAPEDRLLHWLAPSDPQQTIMKAMRRFVRAAAIVSPQTGTLLSMTPRRFRTSLATHMAAQGASRFHIAEILDHTDLQNVEVYVQTLSSIADQVASATDTVLLPLVKRFFGKIIDETEGIKSADASPQVIPAYAPHLSLPVLNTGGLGLCGRKEGLCRLFPPLSCYLCPSFVAFRQGPHQEMLTSLLTFLQQGEGMADERIRKQLNDVCVAITEVLAQLGTSSPMQLNAPETEPESI
jgi:integrase